MRRPGLLTRCMERMVGKRCLPLYLRESTNSAAEALAFFADFGDETLLLQHFGDAAGHP